jgi:integrase
LGNVDRPAAVPATKARQKATEHSISAQLGNDPQKERKEARKARGRLLLDEAIKYLEDRRSGIVGRSPMRESTYRRARRYFEVHWSALARRSVASITEAEIKTELRKIIDHHGKQGARAAKANLSAFFAWSLKEGIAKTNPTIATHALAQNPPRDRVLSDDEIRSIWSTLCDDDFGRIVKLLFFTACRRNEIGGLCWSELDLNTGSMTLPPPRTKSGRGHQLTLPPQAIEVLRQCPRKADRDFLFGHRGGAFCAWGWSKMRLDRDLAAAGHKLEQWGLHDIRRTVRTRLAQIGIKPHVAEFVLGHAAHKVGVAGAYDHYNYADETRDALARWATVLTAIINPPDKTNVTPIRATA